MRWQGLLICLLALVRPFHSEAAEKHRTSFRDIQLDSDTVIFNVETKRLGAELEACFVMPQKPVSGSKSISNLRITLECSDGQTNIFSLIRSIDDYSSLYERRRMDVYADDQLVMRWDGAVTDNLSLTGGDNYILLSIRPDGSTDLYLGADRYKYCATVKAEMVDKIIITGSQGVELPFAVLDVNTPAPLTEQVNIAELAPEAVDKTQLLCGVWSYLDRDNDPDYARLGGNYTVLIAPSDEHDVFNIYYVNGSEVKSDLWKSGMLKGRLSVLPLQNRYRLEWWDSEMNKIDGECHAALEDGILSLNFPLLHTSIRFSRGSEVTFH